MKTAIILPGWEHNPNNLRYTEIIRMFEQAGFNAFSFEPEWARHDSRQWVSTLIETIDTSVGPVTLLGFSMGAMTALLASTKLEIENLIVCSPSGYFREYITLLTPEDLSWGRANIKDLSQLSAVDMLNHLKVRRGFIIAGDKELNQWPDFRQWITDLQDYTSWGLSVVSDTEHEIEAPNYQRTIRDVIRAL